MRQSRTRKPLKNQQVETPNQGSGAPLGVLWHAMNNMIYTTR